MMVHTTWISRSLRWTQWARTVLAPSSPVFSYTCSSTKDHSNQWSHQPKITLTKDHTNQRSHQPKIPPTKDHTNQRSHQPKIPLTTDHTNQRSHQPKIPPTKDHTNQRSHQPKIPPTKDPTNHRCYVCLLMRTVYWLLLKDFGNFYFANQFLFGSYIFCNF